LIQQMFLKLIPQLRTPSPVRTMSLRGLSFLLLLPLALLGCGKPSGSTELTDDMTWEQVVAQSRGMARPKKMSLMILTALSDIRLQPTRPKRSGVGPVVEFFVAIAGRR